MGFSEDTPMESRLNARIAQFMKVQTKSTEIFVGMLIKKCERSC
jgi:hypothetical protein